MMEKKLKYYDLVIDDVQCVQMMMTLEKNKTYDEECLKGMDKSVTNNLLIDLDKEVKKK